MSLPFLRVRVASTSDIPAMVPIINEAFEVESFLEGTRTDEDRLTKSMQKGKFLLGYDSCNDLVASVYVEARGTRGYLGMLAVSGSHQGKGFGRAMVEAAEVHCRQQGCTAMDLTVLNLRSELLPFYSRLEYEQRGTEVFIPSRPLKPGVECHCIVMSKPL
jgi:ribosomal protein S18 acetylase RimI-like enzyme